MIIAIDGPAASGKGTLGNRLAAHFGLRHLDTGLIYRAVAKAVLDAGGHPGDVVAAAAAAKSLDPSHFDEVALKAHSISEAASVVSAIPAVREALLAFQREFAARPPGAVLDGRDIGTVICPDADVKIYVTATPEVRARRRAAEYKAQGRSIGEAEVLADILNRDRRDQSRTIAPLRQAPDAHLLDTTHLDIDAAIRAAIDIVEASRAGRGRG
ncbi:MAG: (d)CMP kinase [Pseudolabrys sp.]|jgi:cytidylate kinase